jgi:hypothetical protein
MIDKTPAAFNVLEEYKTDLYKMPADFISMGIAILVKLDALNIDQEKMK